MLHYVILFRYMLNYIYILNIFVKQFCKYSNNVVPLQRVFHGIRF